VIDRMLFASAIALASLLGAGCGDSRSTQQTAGTSQQPAEVPGYVLSAADYVANITQSSRPTNAVVYESDRSTAARTLGGAMLPDGGTATHVVEFRGEFKLVGVSFPYGADPPFAHQIVIVIDAETDNMVDFGGLPQTVDVASKLGVTGRELTIPPR